ncbi:esterase-like activity of phytase family protein [Ideonella sp. BN130291]|uniref:esterase-like activity of phytase family protein n=1 Tax=Ideonella sp. BN130291 TaxID=3112940 RepID=UPI002E25A7CE|nr:esterase-like activity of phytase family protein [Ideonella sp. BN130291]
MIRRSPRHARGALVSAALLLCSLQAQADPHKVPTLSGWALLPAATFADGPTSGQFAAPNPYGTHLPPYVDKQPVQGFSGVLPGPAPDTFRVMTDNGFGAQANSADALLRVYTVKVDFRSRHGGSGTVSPAGWLAGRPTSDFSRRTRLTLNDAQHQLGLPIQADLEHYYGDPAKPAVAPEIRAGRLLTGADLDIESIRRDKQGHYWFGDEFGPYLVKTDTHGTVLRAAIPLPGVYAPEHKDVRAGAAVANLPGSGGFEGMAINTSGTRLYALLEKGVAGDPAKLLRINEFDLTSEAWTGTTWFYPLEADGTNIGDMTAVDDHRFIVIERNGGTATTPTPPFKKLYLIDIAGVTNGGTVAKTELADLMNLADPDDLNGDGSTVYTLPYVTIEDVLVLDARTLLVINDNNFPYGGGRELASDNTEFIRITLPQRLQR